MLKGKTKELIICILAIAFLVLALTTNVFAEDIGDVLGANNNSNQSEYSQIQNRNVNNSNLNVNNSNVNNSNVNGVNNSNKNVNNNNSNNAAIPYTGVDYSVVAVIAVCGISAIYAYKKIREYKSL